MATSIGSLVASLVLESAAFLRDLGGATAAVNASTREINKSLKTVSVATKQLNSSFGDLKTGVVAFAGVVAARQFVEFGKNAFDAASKIDDLSQRTGFATKSIQELNYAASQGGVSADEMGTALQKLSVNTSKAREGTGDLAAIARKLGIDLSSPQSALDGIAEALKNTDDSAARAQIAVAAFGKAGVALIPVLMDGRNGLDEMAAEAKKFGLVMDDALLKKANSAGDALEAMTNVFKVSFDVGIIKAFADNLLGARDSMESIAAVGTKFGEAVGSALQTAAAAVKLVSDNMGLLSDALATIVAYKAAAYFAGVTSAVIEYIGAVRGAAAVTGVFTAILEKNPIVLIASLVAAGVGALVHFSTSTDDAADAAKRHADALDLEKKALEAQGGALKGSQKAILERSLAMAQARAADLRVIQDLQNSGSLDDLKMGQTVSAGGTTVSAFQVQIIGLNKLIEAEDDASKKASDGLALIASAAGGAGNGLSALGLKFDDLKKKLDDQTAGLQLVADGWKIGAAAAERASIQAEANAKALELGTAATDEQRASILASVEAQHKLNTSVDASKMLDGLRLEGEALSRLNKAYDEGAAAVERATVANESAAKAAALGALADKSATDALLARAQANYALQASVNAKKTIDDMRAENDGLESLLAAQYKGVDAINAVNDANQAGNIIRGISLGLSDKLKDSITAETERNSKLQRSITEVNAVRDAENDLQIANMKLDAAGIASPQGQKAAQTAIERQTKINALIKTYGTTSQGTGKQLLEMWDKQNAAELKTLDVTEKVQNSFAELSDFATSAFDTIGDAITQSLVNGQQEAVNWKNVWKGVLSEVTQEFIKLAAINPLKNALGMGGGSSGSGLATLSSVIGSLGSVFGGSGASASSGIGSLANIFGGGGGTSIAAGTLGGVTSAGGGGFLSGIGSLFSSGSVGAGLLGGFSTPMIGNFIADALGGSVMQAGSAASIGLAAGSSLGFGAIGGLGASLLGLGNKNPIISGVAGLAGSLGGAAIGALLGSAGGPIGAIVGSFLGTALSGLFGGGGPPKAFADTYLGSTPFDGKGYRPTIGQTAEIGSGSTTTLSLAGGFVSAINQIFDAAKVKLNTPIGVSFGFERGKTSSGVGQTGALGLNDDANVTLSKTIAAYLKEAVGTGLEGSFPALDKALTDSYANLQELGDHIATAVQERDKLLAQLDPTQGGNTLTAQIAALNLQFDALATQAANLGISTDLVTAARNREIQALKDQTRLPFVQAAASVVDFVNAQSLDTSSSLSPAARLAEAQKQFTDLLTKVQGGQAELVGSLTQAAGNLLGLGRQSFASSSGFSAIEDFVKTKLLDVADMLNSDEFFDAQVNAIAQQTDVLAGGQTDIQKAVEDVKRSIDLLRQQLAS